MSQVRSKVLGQVAFAAAATAVLYTCPAGFRTIVKFVSQDKSNAGSVTSLIQIKRGANIFTIDRFDFANVPASHQFATGQVLDAGDQLQVTTTGITVTVQVWASGAELKLP